MSLNLSSLLCIEMFGSKLRPYYGVKNYLAERTENNILSLPNRGSVLGRHCSYLELHSEENEAFWYAYPKVFGEAVFYETDKDSVIIGLGPGGWDGAKGDPIDPDKWGPLEVPVKIENHILDFYLYISDWPKLGTVYWRVD